MNSPPLWINGKLCCQFTPDDGGPCGRVMWIRGKTAVCEITTHGGVFSVPDKLNSVRTKVPGDAWKDALPIASSRFRKDVKGSDGKRRSVGVWRVNGDPEHAWIPVRFDVREDDAALTEPQGEPILAGCIVARFRITGIAFRTVLLRPFEISEEDRKYRRWEVD